MSFGLYEQESLLTIIAYDDSPGGSVVALDLLPAEEFSALNRRIYRKLKTHIDRFKSAPGTHFFDLIEDLKLKHPDDEDYYDAIYNSILSFWESGKLNRDFVFSRATLFGRANRLVQGSKKCVEAIQKGITEENCDAAERHLTQSMKTNFGIMDLGVSTRDPKRFLKYFDEDVTSTFKMGIPELDKYDLGPTRKELFLLGAAYGKGKTWGLLHIGLSTLFLSHQDVLYIPLEMSEERACQRVIQICFSYARHAAKEKYQRLLTDDIGRAIAIEPEVIDVPSMYENQADVFKKMKGFQRRAQFLIKAFPPNTFHAGRLDALLDALLAKEGITPGLILVDYPGLSKIKNPAHKRLELGQHIVDYRRVGFERNIAIGAAIQLNRGGIESGAARGTAAAEDISVMHTADNAFIYNQTESEKKLGLARLYVDKARNERDGFEVLLSQMYGAGKWCMNSALMHTDYQKMLKGDDDDG